jgi:hypothetical protein
MEDVYFNGIKNFIDSLNNEDLYKIGIIFRLNESDLHVAQRAIERNIDVIGLLKESRKIFDKNLCLIIYHAYVKTKTMIVVTSVGNLAFRFMPYRGGILCKLCTITTKYQAHNFDDFILRNEK